MNDRSEVQAPDVAPVSAEPYTFVCYSHRDSRKVYREIEWLSENGVGIWYDKGISAGSNWRSEIGTSLLGASHVLFFVSPTAIDSIHCNREINLALDEGIPILPVYLQETELPPDFKIGFARIQALFHDDADYRDRLLATLTSTSDGTQAGKPIRAQPTRRFRTSIGLLGALAVGIVLLGSFYLSDWLGLQPGESSAVTETETIEALNTLAVLPFTNLSDVSSLDVTAEAFSDRILTELAATTEPRVASRTETFRLARENLSLQQLAERLNVAYVLEGSLQTTGSDLRIVSQIIRARDGFHVWSKTYHQPIGSDDATLQLIVENVAHVARSRLHTDIQRHHPDLFEEFRGVDSEAVTLYLDSQEYFTDFVNGEIGDLSLAMQLIETAVTVDPNFATAHWEIAWNHMRRIDPAVPIGEAREKAHVALAAFEKLSPDTSLHLFLLAQVNIALDLDYRSAREAAQEGIRQLPRGLWWRAFLANIAGREGDLKEAIRLMKMEASLDHGAETPVLLLDHAEILRLGGEYNAALAATAEALPMVSGGGLQTSLMLVRARILIDVGRLAEAETLVEEAWELTGAEGPERFAALFVLLGQQQRARKALSQSVPSFGKRGDVVSGYVALGELDRAVDIIRDGIEDHDRTILDVIRIDPDWEPLRQQPGFLEMLDLLASKEIRTDSVQEPEPRT
ncbi:MAG: TIR domain-containing protein [Pseudomonadota bacterium]